MSNVIAGRRPKRVWGLLGLLAIAAVVWIALRTIPWGQGPAGNGDEGLGGAKSPAPGPTSRTAAGTEDLAFLESIRNILPKGLFEALVARGLPPMPPYRRVVLVHTAKQSLEEVVADMGNLMSLTLCKDAIGEFPRGEHRVGHWRGLTYHVKTLRVIEEGRRDPRRVVPLLERELTKAMESYTNFIGSAGGPPTGAGLDDAYFKKHGRYENNGLESLRRHEVLYASFYALACMDQLRSPDRLRQWVELQKWCEKEKCPMVVCKDMSIWLIDKYFRQSGAGATPEGRQFFALTKEAGAGPQTAKRSRWNVPWDVNDVLLIASHAAAKDIATIDVLEIPSELRLDEAAKDAAIDLFLKHVAGK